MQKETVNVNLGGMSHEFHFSMFSKEPHDKELPSKDGVIGLDSIDIPPADPLEQYLLDHENNMNIHERNELDNMFFKKKTILK